MPLIRPGMRKPPPGFDVIQAKLEEFEAEMKSATQEESRGVRGQTTKPRRSEMTAGHKRLRESDDHQGTSAEDKDKVRERKEEEGTVNEASASPSAAAATREEEEDSPVPPLWRMTAINRARTRYVFAAYTKQRVISKEVYDYCVEMQLIDGGLARRWRLPGYERLCCTACGVPGAASLAANITSKYALRDKQERRLPSSSAAALQRLSDDTATCICRVPASQRKNKHFMACAVCGCNGCCSADVPAEKPASAKKGASSSANS
jgi:bud site selection protein 31